MSMRRFPFVAAVLLSVSLLPGAPAHGREAAAAEPGQVALEFFNAYVAVFQQPGGDNMAFLQGSPLVTERFKRALEKLYREAREKDPELGYGADAVIGGQDSSDRFGVKSSKVNGDRARVVLIGIEPANFPMEVKVDLVREDGRWLIDASGDLIED
jgi:hypothetical protein